MNEDNPQKAKKKIFERWGIDEEVLTELVNDNGSLRGMLLGYVAEHKFRQLCLNRSDIKDLGKDNDHDRKKKVTEIFFIRANASALRLKVYKPILLLKSAPMNGWDKVRSMAVTEGL